MPAQTQAGTTDRSGIIGQFGPTFDVPVERGAVRAFARSVYAPWSVYLDDERAVIPPTFLTTANVNWGYTLERPRGTVLEELDHDLSVPLHAEETYLFHGTPPRVDDRLTARACLESLTEKPRKRGGGLTFLVLLTEFRDSDGVLVAEARSTTVTTHGASDEPTDWGSEPPAYQPRYVSLEPPDPFAAIASATWVDVNVGRGPGPISLGPLTMHEMVRYQAAGGEDNPLHYDLAHARAEGFPGMFGVGMHQAGGLASYAARWLGPQNVRSFRSRFTNVFWVGDPLTYDGKVVALREEDGQRFADLELTCTRDSDDAVIVHVWMTFELAV
ncbi:MAG: MaoC family dehydratase N-terminal domain-containing protein [Pseudomonadota bacterium]